MAIKSTDYDERIKRAEAQLKKWKADKKRLATKEAKRDEELRQRGYEYEDLTRWMQSRTINAENRKVSLWEWYQRERRNAGNDM